jgi:two-component system, cell cycle sensor histidine kinase and response regulator CckA
MFTSALEACSEEVTQRADELYGQQRSAVHRRANLLFSALMVLQWIGCVVVALCVSPRTWEGEHSQVHPHLWAALLLGGALTAFPLCLIFSWPTKAVTRQMVAVCQMLWSALLIHLTGGRIETHFHVFGSLAFLAFYRDWRLLPTATVIVAADHLVRGLVWPESVYGVLAATAWRTVEHGAWVLFEDVFLIIAIGQSVREMKQIAMNQARLERGRELTEVEVRVRTEELRSANQALQVEVRERGRAEQRLKTQYATTQILAECTTLDEGIPRFLEAICQNLAWQVGEVWRVDGDTCALRRFGSWHSPAVTPEQLQRISWQTVSERVVGLAGSAWATRKPVWSLDLAKDEAVPNAKPSEPTELRGLLAVPIWLNNEVVGALQFLAHEMSEPDEDLLTVLTTAAKQLGQFIERKLAEESLRTSEARYRALVELCPDAIFIRQEGRIVFINSAATKLLGAENPEQIVGGEMLDLVHEDYHSSVKERMKQLSDSAQPLPFVEEKFLRLDGSAVPVEVGAVPFVFAGKPAVQVIARDLTLRKSLEAQIRQAQKMDAIGTLAGGVAHDFNNILTVISGYSEVLLARLAPDDPLRAPVEQIHKAGARAASLTRQLLVFSRKQVVEPKILDLNAIVKDTEKMLKRLIGEDISLTAVLDPKLGRIKADAGQIDQVLMNLAANARDAMPRGGKLTIETAKVQFDAEYASAHPEVRPGPYILLAVSDDGFGIDSATLSHLFEPFFTTKGLARGTGLGLATVYGIVKESGGHISVYSEVGSGTSFKVYFPRVDEEVALTETPKPEAPETKDGKETVLLVEDEEDVRTFTRHLLHSFGYKVLDASDGVEAMRVSEQHQEPIPLLISDVIMPRMGGRQLAENLKSIRPDLKVLFISGYTDDAIVRHGVLQSDVAFLQKPFTPTALASKVREVLEN